MSGIREVEYRKTGARETDPRVAHRATPSALVVRTTMALQLHHPIETASERLIAPEDDYSC